MAAPGHQCTFLRSVGRIVIRRLGRKDGGLHRSLSSGRAEPVIGRAFARPVGVNPLGSNPPCALSAMRLCNSTIADVTTQRQRPGARSPAAPPQPEAKREREPDGEDHKPERWIVGEKMVIPHNSASDECGRRHANQGERNATGQLKDERGVINPVRPSRCAMPDNWPLTPFETAFLIVAASLTAGGIIMVGVG
jgi:hypothetical protein